MPAELTVVLVQAAVLGAAVVPEVSASDQAETDRGVGFQPAIIPGKNDRIF